MQTNTPSNNNGHEPRRVRGAGYQVDFHTGQRCLLQFKMEGHKYQGTILGIEPYSFVIARLPRAPGIQNCLTPNQQVVVRLEQGGTLFGFTSVVLSSSLKPAPIIMFSYPENVQGLQFRQHKRTRCMLPAQVQSEFISTGVLVTDISMGGCRVVVDWRDKEQAFNMMAGDTLDLSMHLDGDEPQVVSAALMSKKELKRHYSLGLKFESDERIKPLAYFIGRLEGAWAALNATETA